MMRVLVLLIALLSMPVLAADHSAWPDSDAEPAGIELLAQAAPQGQPGQPQGGQPQGGQQQGGQQQGGQQQSGPQRYPGDYCTRHCRHNEVPCGNECMATKGGNAKCTAKKTTTCVGKP